MKIFYCILFSLMLIHQACSALPNILGMGYDAIKGEPFLSTDPGFRKNPLILINLQNRTINGTNLTIPDCVQATRLDQNFTFQYSIAQSYAGQDLGDNIKKLSNISYPKNFYNIQNTIFIGSQDFQQSQKFMYSNNTFAYDIMSTYKWLRVNINLNSSAIKIDPDFTSQVKNSFLNDDWSAFIQTYGIFFVSEAEYGCSYGERFWNDNEIMSELISTNYYCNYYYALGSSFYGKIDPSYNQHLQDRKYFEHPLNLKRRWTFNIGPKPSNLNVSLYQQQCTSTPGVMISKLSLWSEIFRLLPKNYYIDGIIQSYETYLKSYCSNCPKANSTRVKKYKWRLANTWSAPCGDARYNCTSESYFIQQSYFFKLKEIKLRSSTQYIQWLYVGFEDFTGYVAYIGNKPGTNPTFSKSLSSLNITGQYGQKYEMGCIDGRNFWWQGNIMWALSDGTTIGPFGTPPCKAYPAWKPSPPKDMVVCGSREDVWYSDLPSPHYEYKDFSFVYCNFTKEQTRFFDHEKNQIYVADNRIIKQNEFNLQQLQK